MATLTLTPAIGNYIEIAPQTAYLILAAAVGLLFTGAAVGLVGARRAREGSRELVRALADRVAAAHATESPALPGEAVELIILLREAGAGAAAEVAPRLGGALDYVQEIDRHFASRAIGSPPA